MEAPAGTGHALATTDSPGHSVRRPQVRRLGFDKKNQSKKLKLKGFWEKTQGSFV